jgi:hypothetical protein
MRCALPEQVFFDGVAQYQKANGSTPGPGQFAMDSSRHVVLGSSPAGHVVEVSTRWYWMRIWASDVTMSGFRMRHAASAAQNGGLEVGKDDLSLIVDRATIANNVLSDASGRVLSLNAGSAHRVIGNDISRAGQLGIGYGSPTTSVGQGTLFQGNVVHDNNTEDFKWWWEAGGIKASRDDYLTFDRNILYGNKGAGIWTDGNVHHVTFTNNVAHHNLAWGIAAEITRYGVVAYNRVWENGWGCLGTNCQAQFDQTVWVWGSGILSSSSGGLDIHDNISAWNADGIAPLTAQREDMESPDETLVHDNYVFHTNQPGDASDAVMLGWLSDGTTAMTQCVQSGSCRSFANLLYSISAEPGPGSAYPCRFGYSNGCRGRLDMYQAGGADTGSRYITKEEATALLVANGMPTSPESH